jgi:hypothetical protein
MMQDRPYPPFSNKQTILSPFAWAIEHHEDFSKAKKIIWKVLGIYRP